MAAYLTSGRRWLLLDAEGQLPGEGEIACIRLLFIAANLFHAFIERNLKPQVRAGRSPQYWAELIAARRDKSWSLTDCISMAVMQEHDLSEALTTDHHFEQAGFRVLLKA